jgi:cytochrome P450
MLGTSVLTIDGELWLSKRRMLQPIFHKQRLQNMTQQMVDGGAKMLTRWNTLPDGQALNLGEEMKLVTLDIINRTMFSVNVLPEVERIGQSVDVGLHYISDRTRMLIPIPTTWPTPANLSFKQALASLDEYLYRVISERRASAEHPGDLLDMLLEARDEDTGKGMNDEQVRNEVASIYGAGHETTAVALSWAWFALNQNPEVLAKLQQEIDQVLQGRQLETSDLPNLPYTQAVFEETLRLYPPVPMTVRSPEEDTQVGEYDFPKNTLTAISIYNIHQHPDYWKDPQKFTPERFLPENKASLNRVAYIPFLTGPHLCIGNNFALMEGTLLLAMMAQRYEVKLLPGQEVTRDVAITMRPKGGLQVQLLRRKP